MGISKYKTKRNKTKTYDIVYKKSKSKDDGIQRHLEFELTENENLKLKVIESNEVRNNAIFKPETNENVKRKNDKNIKRENGKNTKSENSKKIKREKVKTVKPENG